MPELTPEVEATQEAEQEPAKLDPIQFEDPIDATKLQAQFEDAPEVTAAVTDEQEPPANMTARQRAEWEKHLEREKIKREFVRKVMEARKAPEPEHKPQPLAPAMHARTKAEMEAGAKRVAANAQIEAQRPKGQRPVDPREGTMTPVFRPKDYIPDPKKNQGNVGAREVSV